MQIQNLADQVQRNCHISDARHGSDYGLCTYLMKMREYYRWEMGLSCSDTLDKDHVGDWLTERETLWQSLDEADFDHLLIDGLSCDPFAVDEINRLLNPQGYVYSGGLGASGRSHFFLAELHEESVDSEGVLVAGRELARDLASPPAMNQGELIFVRHESLRRMLWEKLDSWRWSRADNALGRAFACYDFEGNLEGALDQMSDDELALVLLHERGEKQVGRLFGDDWNSMLMDLLFTPAELIVRAIRDHLADSLVTLPALADMERESSAHFYIGNLTGMRKSIYPEIHQRYERWRKSGDFAEFSQAADEGAARWKGLAEQVLALHAEQGSEAARSIKTLVDGGVGRGENLSA